MGRVNITMDCVQHYADIMGMPMAHDGGVQVLSNPQSIKMASEIQQIYLEGRKIYTGLNFLETDGHGDIISLFIKDTWVMVYNETMNLITDCYQIDLGLGEEFNYTYIENYLDKLQNMEACVVKRKDELLEKQKEHEDALEIKKATIRGYQKLIQNLWSEIQKIQEDERKVLEELDEVDICIQRLVGSLMKNKIR